MVSVFSGAKAVNDLPPGDAVHALLIAHLAAC
jgi:hypothetical protein